MLVPYAIQIYMFSYPRRFVWKPNFIPIIRREYV
jgi:hypothetical protein